MNPIFTEEYDTLQLFAKTAKLLNSTFPLSSALSFGELLDFSNEKHLPNLSDESGSIKTEKDAIEACLDLHAAGPSKVHTHDCEILQFFCLAYFKGFRS